MEKQKFVKININIGKHKEIWEPHLHEFLEDKNVLRVIKKIERKYKIKNQIQEAINSNKEVIFCNEDGRAVLQVLKSEMRAR